MINEAKIRHRKSYLMWKDMLSFLKENPNKLEMMNWFYVFLDKRYAFKSEEKSICAKESLIQLAYDDKELAQYLLVEKI